MHLPNRATWYNSYDMKYLHSLLFIILLSGITRSQIPTNFNHFTSDNGLTSNAIGCLWKDSRGFLWIGTDAGLNRFDGKNNITYTHILGDSTSLASNDIATIFEDSLHRMWIGTNAGLSVLEPGSSSFINFYQVISGKDTFDFNKGALSINQFQNKIWIATHDKIIKTSLTNFNFEISVENLKPVKKDKIPYFLPNKTITTKNAIWFLASTGPVCIEDGKTMYNWSNNPQNWPIFNHDIKKPWIASIYNDGDSILYFTTFFYPGVYAYHTVSQKLDSIPFSNHPEIKDIWTMSMARLDKDKLLCSSWRDGIYTIDTKSGTTQFYATDKNNPWSINSNHSEQLLIDHQNTIFVGTDRGLNYCNRSQPQFTIFDISNILISNMGASIDKFGLAIKEDDIGNLWIGTQSGGLFSFTPSTGITRQFLLPGRYNRIWSICYEHDNLLLGTDAGLANFSTTSKNFSPLIHEIPEEVQKLTSHPFIPSSSTFILKDPYGSYWIALFPYGLLKYNMKTKEYIHFSSNDALHNLPGSGIIASGTIDDEGVLWLGYNSNNISAINTRDNTIHNFRIPIKEKHESAGKISSIAYDHKGNLWIVTTLAGLYKYNIALDTFTSYDSGTGLSSNILGSVINDNEGNLWVNASNGLNKIEPESNVVTIYNTSDGFLSNQFNLSPLFLARDSTLYTCSGNYLIGFKPDGIQKNTSIPILVFSSYKKSGEEFTFKSSVRKLNFNYMDRTITFEFYGINFIYPAKTSYAYKLDGYDDYWHFVDKASALYTSLPHGNYTFRIKATNNKVEWTSETTMKVHVEGPIWIQWWFIALCLSFCFLVVYSFYRLRLTQQKNMQAIRNKISRDLHDEIGSALGSISIFSTAAEMMKENQYSEIMSTLGQIGSGARNAMENMSDIVWAINPSNDTFKNLMERLQIYAYKILEAKNINLKFEIPETLYNTKLTLQQRRNIYLILREAVYNVAKYSKANNCTITAELADKKINLQIKDDGHGFDVISKSLGGNGFTHMKQRAEELNAVFSVFSEKLSGTVLTLQLNNT